MTTDHIPNATEPVTGRFYLVAHCQAAIAATENMIAAIRRIAVAENRDPQQVERAVAPLERELSEARRKLEAWS